MNQSFGGRGIRVNQFTRIPVIQTNPIRTKPAVLFAVREVNYQPQCSVKKLLWKPQMGPIHSTSVTRTVTREVSFVCWEKNVVRQGERGSMFVLSTEKSPSECPERGNSPWVGTSR